MDRFETVRARRRAIELSQTSLAERAGVSEPVLCRIELGRRPLTPELALRIEAALAEAEREAAGRE